MTTTITIEVGYQDMTATHDAARRTRWTEQATGHRYWAFPLEMTRLVDIETIADAVFRADNYPAEFLRDSLAGRVRVAMQKVHEQTSQRHHALSVGDRVRVGEVEVVCADVGWKRLRNPNG